MAVGMHGGAPEPPALSTHPIDFRTDPDTIRAIWRVTGGLLIVAGTLYLATTVLYSVAGNLGRAMFAAIVAALFSSAAPRSWPNATRRARIPPAGARESWASLSDQGL